MFKEEKVRKVLVIFEVVLIFLIGYLHAINTSHYANFIPINGTFQNFNPIRRLVEGQIPFRDFTDYLGMGHLYLGTIVTIIFGMNYQGSMVAFTFLAMSGLIAISIAVGSAIFKKKEITLPMTVGVLVLLSIRSLFEFSEDDIFYSLYKSFSTGASARFLRGMILPLIVGAFYIGVKIYDKTKDKEFVKKYDKSIKLLFISALSALAFIWSNDYGISTWICTPIILFFTLLARKTKVSKAILETIIEVILSVFWIFIFVEIFTLGNFKSWAIANFGTGGYQSWYYNSKKRYYIYEIDLYYTTIIQLCLTLYYLVKLFINKGDRKAIMKYGILGFMNMTAYCATNEYHLISGGRSREFGTSIMILTILFEVINYFKEKYIKDNKKVKQIILTTILSTSTIFVLVNSILEIKYWNFDEKEGIYIDKLAGNLTKLGEDIEDAHKFLKGEKIFSTYASAQEVVEDTYQPSGIDYVIHVLGDKKREEYLESFRKQEFNYVVSINENYSPWEKWSQRANWFLYREIYANWHPEFSNSYEVYWKKNEENENVPIKQPFTTKIVEFNPYTKKVIIETDKTISGIADVCIDYTTVKEKKLKNLLMFQRNLFVQDTGNPYKYDKDFTYESNFLKNESKEYVPMTIVNGYGEICLTSCPRKATSLQINSATCDTIFPTAFNYVECEEISHNDYDQTVLKLPYTAKNRDIAAKSDIIELQNIRANVKYSTYDVDYIYLVLDANNDLEQLELTNGNMIEMVQ